MWQFCNMNKMKQLYNLYDLVTLSVNSILSAFSIGLVTCFKYKSLFLLKKIFLYLINY